MWRRISTLLGVTSYESRDIYSRWDSMIIDSPIWRKLPGDALKMVADWLAAGYQSYKPGYRLKGFRLVCRDWDARFTPHIMRALSPSWRIQGSELVSRLRSSQDLYQHTSKVTLRYVKNLGPSIVRDLSRLLPQAVDLSMNGINWSQSACAHPSWGRLFAASWSGFSSVSVLTLSYCNFHSRSDILRVLLVMPTLSKVHLDTVEWTHSTEVVPTKRHNQLHSMDAEHTPVWPFLWIWTLPDSQTSSQATCYHGLSHDEARILTRMAEYFSHASSDTLKARLKQSLYVETWVLSVYRTVSSSSRKGSLTTLGYEVHISCDAVSARGYVRWITLRFDTSVYETCQEQDLPKVALLVAELPHLEKFVLEGARGEYAPPQALEPVRDKVHIWSHREAREYADMLKKQGISKTREDQLPVSPKLVSAVTHLATRRLSFEFDETFSSHKNTFLFHSFIHSLHLGSQPVAILLVPRFSLASMCSLADPSALISHTRPQFGEDLDPLIWRNLPGEVVSVVAGWLLTGCQTRRERYDVESLRLVCREWSRQFLPCLRARFTPGWTSARSGSSILSQLAASGCPFRYATTVKLFGLTDLTPAMLRQLSQLLPNIKDLSLGGLSWTIVDDLGERGLGNALAGFKNVTDLRLSYSSFRTPAYILHAIALLPTLKRVYLRWIIWAEDTEQFDDVPSVKHNQVYYIDVCGTAPVWSLLWFWSYPDIESSIHANGSRYPGIVDAEANILILMARCIASSRDVKAYTCAYTDVQRSLYPQTWVLSVINAWGCDVECHILQDDPLSRGQIRWIVFRLHKDPAYVFVEQQLPEVGRLLFQLPRLEKVILEWSMTEWTEERDPQAVPEGLEMVKEKIRNWHEGDARKYAQIAQEGPSNGEQLPISPCYLRAIQ
ncbi:hypothetical protein NM688_g3651 [Phlebia brevispora]|uniref:Uncharacterized protein n=1 Tax=Phlebia brevispora TaxID=194682 RepID=A0ACC1T548_9APHY|nr:hypothetical protein NM688_g3651 [Phlebia brevispora]